MHQWTTGDAPISIHALREEGDTGFVLLDMIACYFYPRPPRGGRPSTPGFATLSYNFYPRPPRGGRQDSETNGFRIIKFLSTPSARRATRTRRQMVSGSSNFYPRPPRGGRRAQHGRLSTRRRTFLSTPSARRATSAGQQVPPESQYFYPRPPRGGRPEIW